MALSPISVKNTQALITAYTAQLIHGCGSPSCREQFCDTGKQNIEPNGQHRKWTPRSARALALRLAASPLPRKHLCQYYDGRETNNTEGPHDPSSLEQLICDTSIVRKLCSGEPVSLKHSQSSILIEVERLLSQSAVCYAVVALLQYLPKGYTSQEQRMVLKIIKSGCGYPHRPGHYKVTSSVMKLLDAYNDSAPWPLVSRICCLGDAYFLAICNHLWIHHSQEMVTSLVIWLMRIFCNRWNASPILTDPVTIGALSLIDKLVTSQDAPKDYSFSFFVTAIDSRLDTREVVDTWLNSPDKGTHIFNFACSLQCAHRTRYFYLINHMRMRTALSRSSKLEKVRDSLCRLTGHVPSGLTQPRHLLLEVSRSRIWEDVCEQLYGRKASHLLLPLHVRLGDLHFGQDYGGPQVEFFNLLCHAVFDPEVGMFERLGSFDYFLPGSLEPLYKYEILGLAMALAVHNSITLPVDLPLAMYQIILDGLEDSVEGLSLDAASLERALKNLTEEELNSWLRVKDLISTQPDPDISDAWPEINKSLAHPAETWNASWSFTLSANGLHLEVAPTDPMTGILHVYSGLPPNEPPPTWPGWTLIPTTSTPRPVLALNNPPFTRRMKLWLVIGRVYPQLTSFLQGWHHIFPRGSLKPIFHEATFLRQMVQGTRNLDVGNLREACLYETQDEYLKLFWEVISTWTPEMVKGLVRFVTALERTPVRGEADCAFEIIKDEQEKGEKLPRASTCFRKLFLPIYKDKEMLDEKLRMAVEMGVGFGDA